MAQTSSQIQRPPVITIMGHIDHGKSTLLDYIRSTESVAAEAGGITQHLGAYEVAHPTTADDGTQQDRYMTFLDTPGHEAFAALRSRGANVADIAILIVAADDGVKAQTREAIECIQAAGLPMVVAINKIDVSGASVDRVKQQLAEAGVYLEGYGGQTSYASISAKDGTGISELLDLLVLTADLESFTADPSAPASGIIIEADVDAKRGVAATCIIKDGTLKKGQFVVAGSSFAPIRIMEDDTGADIGEATVCKPVRIVGFKGVPPVGAEFATYAKKKQAEEAAAEASRATREPADRPQKAGSGKRYDVPIIVRADVMNSLDAVTHEVQKLATDYVAPRVVQSSVGEVTENDIQYAASDTATIVVAFNTKVAPQAQQLADEHGVALGQFSVIYELSEWLTETIEQRRPKVTEEVQQGSVRVIKRFSKTKDTQVLGARVDEGVVHTSDRVRVMRRGVEVTRGHITNLQREKQVVEHIDAGNECGIEVHAKIDIAPGDILEAFTFTET